MILEEEETHDLMQNKNDDKKHTMDSGIDNDST